MSYKVTALILSKKTGSTVRKSILLAMADVANHDGSDIWVSNTTIAAQAEVTRETVSRNLRAFKNEGLIRAMGTKKCDSGHTIIYNFNLRAVDNLPDAGCDAKSHLNNQGVTLNMSRCDSHTPQGVTQDHTNHPKPSLNHIYDSQSGFAKFFSEMPTTKFASKAKAESAFMALSIDEQKQAIGASTIYANQVKTTKPDFVQAPQRFLTERIFTLAEYQYEKPNPIYGIPEQGSVARKLYDALDKNGRADSWGAWFTGPAAQIDGLIIKPKTGVVRRYLIKEFGRIIKSCGFTVGAVT